MADPYQSHRNTHLFFNTEKFKKKNYPWIRHYSRSWLQRIKEHCTLQPELITELFKHYCSLLGPIYTKRQCQHSDDACDMLSLTTMESLENGAATYFGAAPLWSMRAVSPALTLPCR